MIQVGFSVVGELSPLSTAPNKTTSIYKFTKRRRKRESEVSPPHAVDKLGKLFSFVGLQAA
jgi:hypothetical protein